MMKIQSDLLQKKADAFYQKARDEYLKRLQAYAGVSVSYVKNEKQMAKAAAKGKKKYYVTCGEQSLTSPEFAEKIQDLSVRGESSIDFYIGYGGEDDMEPFCLSSFTMEPSLTATVLLEQIYRAYRIMNHQAYHK